jgi:pyruvate/2-oxoglutarate dehydrogenase complex dihydrolipoamide acyltransferase (E2) component
VAKVTMPQLGESVAEGTIGRWLKKPGDRVEKYEPIVEVVTDKVNAEVPSPFAGVLTAILAEEGATVPNNAEIAEIETTDSDVAAAAPQATPPASAPPAASPSAAPVAGPAASPAAPPVAAPATRPALAAGAPMPPASGDPEARMTPAVRRLLREHGLSACPGFRDRRRRAHHPR